MKKVYGRSMFFWLTFVLVVSCSTQNLTGNASTATKSSETANSQGSTLPTQPTKLPATTLSSAAAPSATATEAIYYVKPEPTTDGKLKLSIRESRSECHKPDENVKVVVGYENLTKAPLTITEYNVLSRQALFGTKAQLFPILSSIHNVEIFTPEDFMNIDAVNLNPPVSQEIGPLGTFDTIVEYRIPAKIQDPNGKSPAQTILPGQYLLKFSYISTPGGGAWEGKISSNQIKICIYQG